MNKNKKLGLDDFIRLKALKDEKEQEILKFRLIDGDEEIVIENIIDEDEAYNISKNIDPEAPAMELWDALIYASMPELAEKEVLEHFGCENNPVEVVSKIFGEGDRRLMGVAIRNKLSVGLFESVKN